MGSKAIFWGQPNKNNVVRPGEFIVPHYYRTVKLPNPVFYAISNSPEVHIGTGGLTTVWASGGYIWNGSVYEAVAPNTPIWVDGWLQYYPEATNYAFYSNNLTNVWWTPTNVTVAQDAIGLTGAANIATRLTATANTGTVIGTSVTAPTGTNSGCFYVKRDVGASSCEVTLDGGATWENITLSTEFEKFTIEKLDGGQIGFRLAFSGDSIIVGNAELHLNKNIAEVSGLPPIFTESSEVTMDRTAYSFDIANHDNAQGAWYCEVQHSSESGVGADNAGLVSLENQPISVLYENISGVEQRIRGYDGVNVSTSPTISWASGETFKAAIAYDASENLKSINANGTASADGAYDGDFSTGGVPAIYLATQYPTPAKIRNLRRYDTDYEESKYIIDVLMSGKDAPVKPVNPPTVEVHDIGIGGSVNKWGYFHDPIERGTLSPETVYGIYCEELSGDIGTNEVVLLTLGGQIPGVTEILLDAVAQTELTLTWDGSAYTATDSAWAAWFQANQPSSQITITVV